MMKRLLVLILSLFFLPLAFSFTTPGKKKKIVQTIIIDPGHGGRDGGAGGSFSTEAQICLEIGLKLGKTIEQNFPGIKVLYTRTTDIIPGNKPDKNQGLRYRADFANQSGADLFISIHCNSAPKIRHKVPNGYRWVGKGKKRRKVQVYRYYYTPNPAHGTETYVWAADESDHKTDMIKPEDEFGETDSTLVAPDMNDPVMKAFQLLYAKRYFENSLRFADLIEKEFVKEGRFSRGVKQRNDVGIWVLHATGMPSVLVETGFISNKEEEQYLNSEKGQEAIVKNLIEALRSYIILMEKPPASGNNGNKSPAAKSAKTDGELINRKDKPARTQ
jgi:N-acetylmuramoyl-L-alanine amidase